MRQEDRRNQGKNQWKYSWGTFSQGRADEKEARKYSTPKLSKDAPSCKAKEGHRGGGQDKDRHCEFQEVMGQCSSYDRRKQKQKSRPPGANILSPVAPGSHSPDWDEKDYDDESHPHTPEGIERKVVAKETVDPRLKPKPERELVMDVGKHLCVMKVPWSSLAFCKVSRDAGKGDAVQEHADLEDPRESQKGKHAEHEAEKAFPHNHQKIDLWLTLVQSAKKSEDGSP
jgi:hypothetical protein